MNRGFLLVVGVAVGVGAWLALRRQPVDGLDFSALSSGGSPVDRLINTFSGVSVLRVSLMKTVDRSLLGHANVMAFLKVIRSKESSLDDAAYNLIVGGKTFASFADHPRVKGFCWLRETGKRVDCATAIGSKYQFSTAAGAYQITASTWDETRAAMKLPDFSPSSQDLAAIGRIKARGALEDVKAGRLSLAISKLVLEWEAFKRWPDPVPYKKVFVAAGGTLERSLYA